MDELKALLPEIQEKVEDANESLKTASTAKTVSRECKCLREEARLGISALHNAAGGGVQRSVTVPSNSMFVRVETRPRPSLDPAWRTAKPQR